MVSRIIDIIQGKPAVKRHKDWPKIRKEHLKKYPECAMCGGTKNLQVHHIYPVHMSKDDELNRDNLITLCRSKKFGIDCHLFIGHGGDFKKVMRYPDVLIDELRTRGFKGHRSY